MDWSNTSDSGQNALDHVNRHGAPNYQRENHGVFNGDPQTMVEQAWSNRSAATPISDGMGGTIYNMKMQDVKLAMSIMDNKWTILQLW